MKNEMGKSKLEPGEYVNKVFKARKLLKSWIDKQGHNKCWYCHISVID